MYPHPHLTALVVAHRIAAMQAETDEHHQRRQAIKQHRQSSRRPRRFLARGR